MTSKFDIGIKQFDEDGQIFFWKTFTDKSIKPVKVYPTDLGYVKMVEQKVYIKKRVSSTTSISDEEIFFEMMLIYQIPLEARYSTLYFYKARSGNVLFKSFSFGHCMKCSPNDPEFVHRGKVKKCEPDTIVPKGSFIYEIDPATNEFRQDVSID